MRFVKSIRLLGSIWLLVLAVTVHAQSFSLVSWNIQNMGKTKLDSTIHLMADILRDADIVAIQEVVAGYGGPQAVARLADALNRTGAKWDYRISSPTNKKNVAKNVSERYAFFFKTAKVKLVGTPMLEQSLAWSVPREPYVGRFAVGADTFLVVNYHARPHDQQPEREAREVLVLHRKYKGEPLIYLGDWNMDETHKVFREIRNIGYRPALNRTRTTLGRKIRSNGAYFRHAIDNIWYHLEEFELMEARIIDLVQYRQSLALAREMSDHVPVVARLGFTQNRK